jgi:DNA-binding NarL/FixJ family response regulator
MKLTERTGVILDPHPLWLDGLSQLLSKIGIQVIGVATNSDDAVAMIDSGKPDILVLGLEATDEELRGFKCLRRAREVHPDIKVIVVSPRDDPRAIDAAFADGASAYCVKSADPEDLAAAIRQSFEHSIYLASGRFPTPAPEAVWDGQVGAQELTRREREILQLVAEGHSNSQLARMLWVTEQTVKFHLSNIYRKLNVTNRTEASRWAQLHGLLPTAPEAVARSAAAV